MNKLKIGLLSYRSDPFSGGQGIYVKNVSESLLHRGHDITIFSGNPLPDVDKRIKVVEIETPGYFETFNSLERLKIFRDQEKSRLNIWDFIETFTGTFTEPIFFGKRLIKNGEFLSTADSFDIFHDNQSISEYPESINKKLITTLHHPIHVDRDIDLANEKSFFEIDGERWFRTGDQGAFDEDGFLYLTGRLKEIINRGGEKISPLEVDSILLDHPEIKQVVTFAVPHPKLGEEVAVAVVLSEGSQTDEKDIRVFAKEKMADFKVPRQIIILDEIPKGATGKMQRIGMAEKLGLL